ncbi:DUF4280 domain-containing protein [Tenacibaculum maritimum]|uniref:DUF4280 domain-containing protein n=1 Tax=Tenacibaculum maritimum TaxID=107401 RepID=UPI0012E5ABEF|nr:DUF4280 domain-containing protein [Tenacibaculum maritimum]CAA0192964.1 conserved hypothetical protein [Tenacibaculum maritimum]
MSEKHLVVQGATCECQYGNAPDILKVASHSYEYANDKEARQKPIATSLEIGQPFEKNTFGNCKLQPTPGGYKPCQPNLTEWQGFYEDAILKNGGYILLENSKAICAIAGAPCVKVADHGQAAEACSQNMKNADKDTSAQLNPMVNPAEIGKVPTLKSAIEEGA